MATPVHVQADIADLANATQTTVEGSAVSIKAANDARRAIIIQNVGSAPMRVGLSNVTATTGIKLAAGETLTISSDAQMLCPTAAVYAIRDGSTSTTACVAEITR